ncbi:glycoside hydrolase family 5 protein [Nitrospirales bacterium NOB]|nr:glycoside hydrolase family 5 protein [Nitrospirales bacterium NOB]
MELFKSMVMAGEPIMADFERERLMPFYQRVRQAIRQVDADSILFLEPCMSANIGIPSSLTPLLDEHGHRDPQQAYAPHGYDIVVDTTATDLNSNARVELIFRRHAETSRKLEMPMLVGEWGAYYENQDCVEAARHVVQQFDAIGCGDTYWAYSRRLGSQPLRKALERSHTGG